jgi:hypothetical protein
VPGNAELVGDHRDCPVVEADLLERPLPGSFGEHRPGRDRLVLLGPGLVLAQTCRQEKTRLRHLMITGVPATGRSRTVTVRRSFTFATAPHTGQPTSTLGVSANNVNSPSTSS